MGLLLSSNRPQCYTKARFHISSFQIAPTQGCKPQPRLLAPTLHPNMRDSVRLLQMTLHWHMTGERHFKFLTGRDISPGTHGQQTAQERGSSPRRSAHPEARWVSGELQGTNPSAATATAGSGQPRRSVAVLPDRTMLVKHHSIIHN